MEKSHNVLIVDDEILNLNILSEYLEDAGYRPVKATDGVEACRLLEESPDRFSAVLLDRMMPEMNGMEVLKRIKDNPGLNMLPVIFQTAKASKEDIREGLQAGAYYYVTKPFDEEAMLAVIKTAIEDFQRYRSLQAEVRQATQTLTLMREGTFYFRTLEESNNLVTLLANACPQAGNLVMGLSELMVNAVEHGNLGITYDEKSKLNEQGQWFAEVRKRLTLPEYENRYATLEFIRGSDEVRFLIKDQGDGFQWEEFMDVSPERVFDSHGRGIAMAKMLSFKNVEYKGKGNEVLAIINL